MVFGNSFGGFSPAVAVSPDGLFVYETNQNTAPNTSGRVLKFDSTGGVLANIPVGVNPMDMAIAPNGSFLYVTNFGDPFSIISGNVSVIDAANNVVATITVGSNPLGVAITPDSAFAYVVNGADASGSVSVINTATDTVTATITVGSLSLGIAITPDGSFAYVLNGGFSPPSNVSVINTATKAVVATITIGNATNTLLSTVCFPQIAITPDGSLAYAANRNHTASVIDTGTKAVIATVTIGNAFNAIAIGPTFIPLTPCSLQAPQHLTGIQKKNDSGLVVERFNHLTWSPNPSGLMASGYFVYRNGVKIATLPATTFSYEDHNRKKGVTTVYTVRAFDDAGNAGPSVAVTVK